MAAWLTEHWFDLVQTLGIVGSFWLTRVTLKADTKARRIENLVKATEQHREIWSMLFERPELARVLQANVDLSLEPITDNETLFVRLLILHLNVSFQAAAQGLFSHPERLAEDVHSFFTLPIPRVVWGKLKLMQDAAFVAFVESCLRGADA